MRAFIALNLPERIKESVSGIKQKLSPDIPGARWVKPGNLHLTLKFLGDISPLQLEKIKKTLPGICGLTPGFRVKLDSLGIFSSPGKTGIIWIGCKTPPGLARVAKNIETGLKPAGIPEEKRAFRAHVTIARIKTRIDSSSTKKLLGELSESIAAGEWEFECEKTGLFESVPGPEGPDYIMLDEFSFKAA
ncbi:MAG: RNA 2',3'-cyclic phosphodiesterase [Candidatus Omnitrophica bacterium]|nr:RNA 2',3'-cyclic phosphodiesterase [Candidatus Omnitrophota bacterium]MDD5042074.1 RNA 2',3'-cyclic phosphodiesterase [Candidatus Omnitrophota bacterium]MDD5500266.1 RNA 2',3'-cyclic phosphodiesterase [Candidatus Omnitrophota bacterium]